MRPVYHIKRFLTRVKNLKHWDDLRRLLNGQDPHYQAYLRGQLRRTLIKQGATTGVGSRLLCDKLLEFGQPLTDGKLLCIGCRDTTEIDYFRNVSKLEVVGIDLLSSSPEILIMDMHKMTFPDNSFGLVFSCHSLEHAWDVNTVVNEIVRVAKPGAMIAVEVPVKFEPNEVDRVDFNDLEGLVSAFGTQVARVFWTDEQAPKTPLNTHGVSIVRAVFSLT